MRVLLTGAQGNLGSALQKNGPDIQWMPIGRENWSSVQDRIYQGIDVILHAAADLTTDVKQNPSAIVDSNLMTTANLLELAKKHNVRRFVFTSSCAVYGRMQITSEDLPLAPISLNGIMKAANEKLVEEFCAGNGIAFEIYRLFNTVGGKDHFSILNHLKKSIQNDKPFLLNNDGISQRDFVHVDDVANILIHFLRKPPEEKYLNIGSGHATKIGDVVQAVKKKYPQLKIQHAYKNEAEYSRADITRLRKSLGEYRFRDVLQFVQDGWDLN